MRTIATALIVLVALVNLAPVSGVVSAERLGALYGVAIEDSNLLILLRHRAVLFGIVGTLLLASAFYTPLRTIGMAAGLISMLSFLWIAWLEGGANPELRRIAGIDLVASVALVAAGVLDHLSNRSPASRRGQ